MTILHLSDTHGQHPLLGDLPPADVFVHSGDFTMRGTEREVADFVAWLATLPYSHKLFVAGNHDKCLYGKDLGTLPTGCHYLRYSGLKIEGIRFHGIPMFKADAQSGLLRQQLDAMPADVDVLISHQPPYGMLDTSGGVHYGSEEIRESLRRVCPRYHLFGHVHDSYGRLEKRTSLAEEGTTFVNSSLLDEDYNLVNSPQVIRLIR